MNLLRLRSLSPVADTLAARRLVRDFGGHWRRASMLPALVLWLAGCGGGGSAADAGSPAALAADTRAAGSTLADARATAASIATPSSTASEATTGSPADTTWIPCAPEGQTCAFSGARDVRYGAGAAFVVRTLTGGTPCNNAVFGDPAWGVVKSCSIAAVDTPPAFDPTQWTVCASEGGYCAVEGTRNVRYGTVAQATVKPVTGGTDCSNAVFGDPIFGQAKTCWSANPPVDTGWVACASEGQRCSFTGTHTVRYGAGSAFATGVYTDGVDCSNAVFGDPIYGVAKSCSVSTAVVAGGPPVATVASVTVPALTQAAIGSNLQIAAQALDASGVPIGGSVFTWTVADTSIATIDPTGTLTPTRAGYTTVTASTGGKMATGLVTVRGPVPIPTRSRYVGTNLATLNYFTTLLPFADLMKSGGGWSVWNDNGGWVGQFPSTAPDGTPTSLAPGQHAMAHLLFEGAGYPAGQYVILWDGDGTVSAPWGSLRVVSSAPHRLVVEPTSSNSQMWVAIDATTPSNPVRNVRFLVPGTESTYETQPFNPEFLRKTAPYSVLRFMDWGNTNGNGVVEWADRSHLSDATWAGGSGVPLEVMIQLANTLHVDPWFCIPHMASDDYVLHFAQLLHDRLDPTLKPHIEYSNEMWNTGFGQTQWALSKSQQLGLANPWGMPSLFYAKRSVEIFRTLQQVYGSADAGRLVRVLSGQSAWTQFLEDALAYGPTASNADVIAVAPYFVAAGTGDPANAAATLGLSASQIVDRMLVDIRGNIKSQMTAHAALAGRYRLALKAYESGPGDTFAYFPEPQQAPMVALFSAAHRSPRMKDVYTEFYTQWKSVGGDTMVQYYDVGGWSTNGFWGALEYVYEDPAAAPKYQGLLSFIQSNPSSTQAFSAAPNR